MSLWWLQPGWTDALCPRCGTKIWPEDDPDWGLCYICFTDELQYKEAMRQQELAMKEDDGRSC